MELPDSPAQASPNQANYRIYSPATLAAAIKDFRITNGLTQAELAAAIGAHRQYVSDLERANFTEQVERLLLLFDRLGVRVTLTMEGS